MFRQHLDVMTKYGQGLWQNLYKGYGHQILAAETPRDANSVETVKSLDSDVN